MTEKRTRMIRQRLRGLTRTTLTACVPWTVLGLITGIVFQFDLIPGMHFGLGRAIPGGFVTVCTVGGAVIGILNGLAFSALVLATERGNDVDKLRAWRVGMWGALATGGTVGLLIHSPLAAAIGAVLGASGGLAAVRIVRRTSLPSGTTRAISG